MKRKNWWIFIIIVIIIVIAIIGMIYFNNQRPNEDTIKIGAVIPLSGPSALWGESLQNGMNLALVDHPELVVQYEDSKGDAADGLNAYRNLELQKPDVFVSSLSIISVPLASLTKEEKIPMIIAQSAASNITNEYAFRYYTDASHYATPPFTSDISPIKNITRIAVLYRNDEYAKSVSKKIQELSLEQGKKIVFFESFEPNTVDFSTMILKIKESNAQALLFVPTTPSESLGILKKAVETNLTIPLIEASNVLSDPNTLSKAPNVTFYTNEFAFSIKGNSEEFKQRYTQKYGHEPNFMAAFGYDIINLISTCKKDQIKECLNNKKEVNGVTGKAENITNNDIIIPLNFVKFN
jgi:branched-chain amino acid transport system substrate-binding protein